MRLEHGDRSSVQAIAARLYVRESDIYRFAVNQFLTRFEVLLDQNCGGKDLLPLFLELREELNHNLKFKKNQLYNIINSHETSPDKYVSMADIELLLLPQHIARQRLFKLHEPPARNIDTDSWLRRYFIEKYYLDDNLIGEPV